MKKTFFGFAFIALMSVMASCGNATAPAASANDSDSVAVVDVDTTVVDSVAVDTACVE